VPSPQPAGATPPDILALQGVSLFRRRPRARGRRPDRPRRLHHWNHRPKCLGKTSVLNCVTGFYRPQQGSIRFKGRDLPGVAPDRRAAMGIARTFQNIALFEGMTVLDNIKLGAHAHLGTGVFSALLYSSRARREEWALREEIEREIIDFLEIEHLRRRGVGSLSYGLQKRVELARALAMRPGSCSSTSRWQA